MAAMNDQMRLGARAEDAVAAEMVRRGYVLVARNERKPWGELDVVCRNATEWVFVEVRSRGAPEHEEDALDSLSPRKRAHVRRAAEIFLAHRPEDYEEVRFFAASVTWDQEAPCIRIIEDAF